MKKNRFWKILLGVVVAVVVLGAIGFGFARHWMWNGRYGEYGKMPHDIAGEMPCDADGGTLSEGESYGAMPCEGFSGYGMGRMPHMRGGYHMVGGWGRRGHSPLTGLLLLVLVVLGVMHFTRYRRYYKFYHHGPMHMHPGYHHPDSACCCEEPEHTDTPESNPNPSENN